MLSALSCFGPRRVIDDEWDVGSHGSEAPDGENGEPDRPKRKNPLFPHKKALNRDALKQRLKKILDNVKKEGKARDPDRDPEFVLLGKIYSETEDGVSDDLSTLARNRDALNHLMPFVLNCLLYGNREREPLESRSKKSGSLKMSKANTKEISLNGAAHLVKNEFSRKLETFLYTQALNSVHVALDCSWYFTASLFLGPQECYHKTMTMLLGMESVVTNAALPGDLFRRAGMTNSIGGVPRELRAITPGSSAALAPVPENAPLQIAPDSSANSVTSDTISAARPRSSVREVALDTKDNLRIQFGQLKTSEEARLSQWLEARRERSNTFHAELDFIKCLTDISNGLFNIDRDLRRDMLRRELEKLNAFIPANVYIPTERRRHRVLRIVPEQAHVFSTKERVPYLLVVEVEDLAPPREEDDHKRKNLRRIASIGGNGGGIDRPGVSGVSGITHNSLSLPPTPEAPQLTQSSADIADHNRPERAFQFEPDVNPGQGDIIKRESSFHIESQFPDDRRPPDEELLKALGEPWHVKSERIRKLSPFGDRPNWRLVSCIVKARDQLRQEMLAQRLIQEFAHIFERAKLPLWLRPYQILSTSSDSGLIETVVDAKSIDSIKKHSPNVTTLLDYFVGRFGGRGSSAYKRAVKNFVQSMAAYSVVQYILNIKDRHNGNLMIDAEGHIVHIDFGFLLSNSPGGNMEFEKAPFKLTSEMVAVMGGVKSGTWKHFRKLCMQGYVEACRNADKIMLMVDLAYPGNESMPCFLQGRDYVLETLRERFAVDLSRRERAQRMARLIASANGNWTTKAYDQFQKLSLGIAK